MQAIETRFDREMKFLTLRKVAFRGIRVIWWDGCVDSIPALWRSRVKDLLKLLKTAPSRCFKIEHTGSGLIVITQIEETPIPNSRVFCGKRQL